MLKQVFGDSSLGQTQTYDWYKRFKNGQTSKLRPVMTIVWDAHQLASHQKMLRKLRICFCKIVD
jgi:hypothetical protein